jgi:hypothetical protein
VKSSTLFKIGFIGMGVCVVGAISPVVLAVLGNPHISNDLGFILNEKTLSIGLIFFTGVILRGVMVKNREAMIAGNLTGQPPRH